MPNYKDLEITKIGTYDTTLTEKAHKDDRNKHTYINFDQMGDEFKDLKGGG